jgi:hypothetical protein
MSTVRSILSGWGPERVLCVVAALLAVPLAPALYVRAMNESREAQCRANLRAIYQAIQSYRRRHNGAYPALLVSTRAPLPPGERPAALAPRDFPDTSKLICPADPRGGEFGLSLPCSYEYQLQELGAPDPAIRQRVQKELIERFGPRLRLLQCVGHHPGRNGFLTIAADGRIDVEVLTLKDPQKRVRESLWDAALKGAGPQGRSRPRSAPKSSNQNAK